MKPTMLRSALLIALPAAIFGCRAPKTAEPPAPTSDPNVEHVSLADVGLDPDALDRSADACTDFYQFACGGWVEKTEIPGDQARWMRSFSEINDRNEQDLRQLLEEAASAGATDPASKKLGDYYAACMDEAGIEASGLEPLEPLLQRIGAFGDAKGEKLEGLLAALHQSGVWAFFDISSTPDDKDATRTIGQMDQNGLGLPDREYYLVGEKRYDRELLDFYRGHVAAMLKLAGYDEKEAEKAAEHVVRIETQLAENAKSRVARRNPQLMYNRIDRAGLKNRSEAFQYEAYLDALVAGASYPELGVKRFEAINVTSTSYFEKLNDLVAKLSPEAVRGYLTWQLIHHNADALPKAFVDENFRLLQRVTGQKEQKPRWKRCVASTDRALGELLGQEYVEKRFLPESKEAVQKMVFGVRDAFRKRLPQLAWMDDETRAQALAKLEKVAYLVGYPEKWREYPFAVERGSYVANVIAARQFENERRLSKIEKPVDRSEWFMTPQTVNAYYHPNMNHMVFPAGILQPPFFDPKASLAVNMGAIGMVVGHELTHGFDDRGSQFDGDGNLKSWWQPEVRTQFEERAGCIEKQYGDYEVLPGVKLNGKLTLGENIADNAGALLAYEAFRAMSEETEVKRVADGFDEEQQFFLAIGQVWCAKYTEELARLRATTDPHSHPRWRVNGSVRNLPGFAEAFQCQEGTPMNPANTCSVW